MKTLRQIVESAIATVSAGVFSDDRNITTDQLELKVHEARALWIQQTYAQTKQIHPDWIQRFYPDYIAEAQGEKCRTVFKLPTVILFSDGTDGLRYFGASSYADDFMRISSRTALASMMRHSVMKTGRRNYVLLQNGIGECYTIVKIKDPICEGVFSFPTDIETYNKNEHQYPCEPAGIDFIEKYLVQTVLRMEISTSPEKNVGANLGNLPKSTK